MIIVIDNYDSFVHNLARYCRLAGAETEIIRNDEAQAEAILAQRPSGLVLSPGPHAPKQSGVCLELLARAPAALPVFGVCLGHQCLVEAFGGRTARAERPLHGQATRLHHQGGVLFDGVPSPFDAGRYHSLISVLPNGGPLAALAHCDEGELMAVGHQSRPWFGVQFHPESVLTPPGQRIVQNFIDLCHDEKAAADV